MAVLLTDRIVRDLPLPRDGFTLSFDSEVKGFGCRVMASGARAFVLQYRLGGRQRRYTIGSYPDWSTKDARAGAAALKREIDGGRDPAGEREHERTAPTMAQLCDRYLAEHVEVHNKARTVAGIRNMLNGIIKPKLGRLKAEAVDHDDVARLHRELRATPRHANHVVAILSKMFSLSERRCARSTRIRASTSSATPKPSATATRCLTSWSASAP